MIYPKPLTIEEQIELLKSRGLRIEEQEEFLRNALINISYQRFKPYFSPFYHSPETRCFQPGTTFSCIMHNYEFDARLREIVFQMLAVFEIRFRAKLINLLSCAQGSDWLLKRDIFCEKTGKSISSSYDAMIAELKTDCNPQSDNYYIRKFYLHYPQAELPPSWAVIEAISFGKLCRIYTQLKLAPEKREIAHFFGAPSIEIFESWIAAFRYVRNICAHHSLLWRRKLTSQLILPARKTNKLLHTDAPLDYKGIYILLTCLLAVADKMSLLQFRKDLLSLLNNAPDKQLRQMSFPETWKHEYIWQSTAA
ncbi:MAG: Abi family protein [Bacteroidota bacterium]|jgi:abortive infection bacteriophage resistance protein